MMTQQEKKQLFEDAVRRKKKPARVPLYSSAYTYKVFDVSNYKLSEYLYDYDKIAEVQCKFHEKYEYDCYHDLGGRNNMPVLDELGTKVYFVNDEVGAINYKDTNYMKDEDWDKIINKGFMKYFKEDYLLQKYPSSSKEEIFNKFSKAMKESKVYEEAIGNIINKFFNEYQALWRSARSFYVPMEYLFCSMRGMTNISKDLRRKPGKVKEALDIMWEESRFFEVQNTESDNENKGFSTPYATGGYDHTCAFDYLTGMLAHTMLNTKQFEKFVWPYYKETIDYLVKSDQTVMFFVEGDILRLAHVLEDIPKGHVAILSEMDDVFEMKKRIGDNITIVGGYPIDLLRTGTKEQCIDFCKKIMDEVAYDGGYIYSESKLLSFPNDALSENLKVVTDYFKEYGVYK